MAVCAVRPPIPPAKKRDDAEICNQIRQPKGCRAGVREGSETHVIGRIHMIYISCKSPSEGNVSRSAWRENEVGLLGGLVGAEFY